MSVSSVSTALIPYTPPKSPMEFIRAEVERGLANGSISIEQTIPRPISSSPSIDLINLNLSSISKIFSNSFGMCDLSLSNLRIHRQSNELMMTSQPLFLFSDSMGSNNCFNLCHHFPKISENVQKLMDSLAFDDLQSVTLTSRVSSTKKLNGDEIAETLQSEASFTIATDKKPIVATYGCSFCVALGGYDETNNIAFIVHFSNEREVRASGTLIFYNITKLAKVKIETPIKLHLRGGIKGRSEAIIEAIKIWMRQREDLPMEIASQDILDCEMCFGPKSLSVDSRNGKVSEYDPLTNPRSRGISDLDAVSAMISAFQPSITLAYSPK